MRLISGQRDLTKGNMLGNLLSFSVPFLLANLLQALYGAVDLVVIGKFGGGSTGVAAIAAGSEVMHLVMSFLAGLTTGTTVLIGNFFGAGDRRNLNRTIGMTLCFIVILGILLTVLIMPFIPLLVTLLRTPEAAIAPTKDYMLICSAGIIFIIGYNALSAIFRGFGNSTAPLIFVGAACLLNVIGDLLLVAVFHMGVAGAAYATVGAQALSMLFALWYLCYGNFGFQFRLPNFRLHRDLAWKFLKVGIPIATQSILINVSFLFIFSVVNSMGVEAAAGYGIVNRINGFTMLPAVSFAMAMAAITAQNIGANKPVRAIRTLWTAVGITMGLGVIFLLILQFMPRTVIELFIDAKSTGAEETVRQGILYAKSFSWEYILVPIVFCTNGFFNGCGRSFFSMMNNLVFTFLVRVPVSYFFSLMAGATLYEVGFAAPLASFSSNVVALIFLFSGKWHLKRPQIPGEKK